MPDSDCKAPPRRYPRTKVLWCSQVNRRKKAADTLRSLRREGSLAGRRSMQFFQAGQRQQFWWPKTQRQRQGNGKPSNKDKPSDVKSKKVLSVIHHDGSTRNHELHEPHPQPQHDSVGSRSVTFQDDQAYGCYFTYMIRSPSKTNAMNKVYGTNMQALCQYIVLDTACQKSCCSSRWMEQHDQLLGNYHLCTKYQEMHQVPRDA